MKEGRRRCLKNRIPERKANGVISVFFALLTPIWLGLLFFLIESARIQAARVQIANITDLGHYSLFSEFEKALLTEYEIFGLDGGYGGGRFSESMVQERLEHFLRVNTLEDPEDTGFLLFDPFGIRLTGSDLEGYALLTDDNGEPFYQQAVACARKTAAAGLAEDLLDCYQDSQKVQEMQETYESEKAASDKALEDAEKTEQQMREEVESSEEWNKDPYSLEKAKNPLPELASVIRRGILKNVLGTAEISSKKVPGRNLASQRHLQKGTLKLEKKYGSLEDDLFFREYLLDFFPDYLDKKTDARLEYQLEYILCGKNSDRNNLKATAAKLLLIREGVNYLYAVQDPEMNAATGSLAFLVVGWTGLAWLVETLKQGLLMGWAYGESLLDVRTLFAGGRVPLLKDRSTWYLSLENLGNLAALLDAGGADRGQGLAYRDYLRLLLNLQPVRDQKRRGLDMIELNLSSRPGLSGFRADHCITAVKDVTRWHVKPVFSRVTAAFLRTGRLQTDPEVTGGFSYEGKILANQKTKDG